MLMRVLLTSSVSSFTQAVDVHITLLTYRVVDWSTLMTMQIPRKGSPMKHVVEGCRSNTPWQRSSPTLSEA